MDNRLLTVACKALDDKFARDITVMDIGEISGFADYFIITEGTNSNQIKAMADNVAFELKKEGVELINYEGSGQSSWLLLDFGDLIVHIFDSTSRQFYNLERVWGDAKILKIDLPQKK